LAIPAVPAFFPLVGVAFCLWYGRNLDFGGYPTNYRLQWEVSGIITDNLKVISRRSIDLTSIQQLPIHGLKSPAAVFYLSDTGENSPPKKEITVPRIGDALETDAHVRLPTMHGYGRSRPRGRLMRELVSAFCTGQRHSNRF
jgi:hypothetical protein